MKHARNNFDALRLIGALLVLVSHQFALSGGVEPSLGGASIGGLGVEIFFSISGYLIASSWQRDPDVWRFAARRFLRIMPAYALVIVLGALVAGPLYLKNLYFGGENLDAFPTNPHHQVNGSLWTIRYELACYIVFATLAMVSGRWLKWALLAAAVGALLFAATQPYGGNDLAKLRTFGGFFVLGGLLSCFKLTESALCWALLVAFVLEVALRLQVLPAEIVYGSQLRYIERLLVVSPLCIWIGSASWPVLRSAGRFGDLSYGLYVWAWPVTQVGVLFFGGSLAVTLLVTGALAWLSWHFIESPALRLKPQSSQQLKPEGGA